MIGFSGAQKRRFFCAEKKVTAAGRAVVAAALTAGCKQMRRITMNKTELIAQVAEKTGLSKKDSELAVNASLETITETLIQGEKVQLVGFGAFDVKERGVRMGRNPKTKKEIEIPASRVPQFKAGKALKEAVDKK